MAAILFLAPDDLGEAVLASGALAHVLGEGDTLTLVTSPEAAPLFRAAPGLAAQHVLAPGAGSSWRAWTALMRTRFDLIVDARGGMLGRTLPFARRVALKPPQRVRHLTEDWADALAAERPLAPVLWLDAAARSAAQGLAHDGAPLLLLAPGGAVAAKRWPAERFAAVARRLAGGPLAGARILVLAAAARDALVARAIVSSLEADGVAARDLSAGADLLAAAALSERATLVIGNDNVLTHLAAAAGAPVLTLFGPTDERVRAPVGPRTRTLRALDAGAPMDDLSIDTVEAAALDLLHAGGLR